jgi:hypothetical protein
MGIPDSFTTVGNNPPEEDRRWFCETNQIHNPVARQRLVIQSYVLFFTVIDYVNWEVLSYKQIWKKCDLYNYRVVEHEYHFTMYFNMSKIRLVDQLTFIVKWAIFTKRTRLSKQYMVYANVGIVVGLWTGVYINIILYDMKNLQFH